MKKVLTIAGSDSSGGAGIQADIKTMTMNGVYAMSVITAVTAQNTAGVKGIVDVMSDFVGLQLDAVFEDILPDAVKIGMVPNEWQIHMITDKLIFYKTKNIVVDPVMVSTSGSKLMKDSAVSTLMEELLPLAALVTPNIPEAEVLSGVTIKGREGMMQAAEEIGETCGCAVLVKGGHGFSEDTDAAGQREEPQTADDLLYVKGKITWIEGKRIETKNTHGTGCTLSSAIAANLAKNFTLEESVRRAKDYLTGALSTDLDLGRGSGPVNHLFDLDSRFAEEKVLPKPRRRGWGR